MGTLRSVIAIPLGVVVGMATMILLLIPCFLLYPLPSGLDIYDPADAEAFGHHLSALPLSALALVWLAHAGGAFAAAAVCRLVEGVKVTRELLIIGGVFTLLGLVNAASGAYPLWFVVVDLVIYMPAALLGGMLFDVVAHSHKTTAAVSPKSA